GARAFSRGDPGFSRGDRGGAGVRGRGVPGMGERAPPHQTHADQHGGRSCGHDQPSSSRIDEALTTQKKRNRKRKSGKVRAPRVRPSRYCDQMNMKILVKKKSAMRIVIEITTTDRVVDLPTPSVPPVVTRPK